MTWGVNDQDALQEVVDLGVNAVISDEADVLRSVLARR
jgi:glycerophosphoryl diester phosphodiesterase